MVSAIISLIWISPFLPLLSLPASDGGASASRHWSDAIAGPVFFSRDGVKRDTVPRLRLRQNLHRKCSESEPARGTCVHLCVCGARPRVVVWSLREGWDANPAQKEVAKFIISGWPMSKTTTEHTAPPSLRPCHTLAFQIHPHAPPTAPPTSRWGGGNSRPFGPHPSSPRSRAWQPF